MDVTHCHVECWFQEAVAALALSAFVIFAGALVA